MAAPRKKPARSAAKPASSSTPGNTKSAIARPSRREMDGFSARLANLSPERLAQILRSAEEGYLDDWADLCDRMVEVDADIRASYETRLAAIAGARWYVEPGRPTGDPERDRYAADAAAFVERVTAQIPRWQTFVQESLDGVGKGVAAHAKVWVQDAEAIRIERFEWVHTRRFRWGREDWKLRLVDDGETYHSAGIELDPEDWFVHAPKTVAGYSTRVGVLRACAWPYLFKRWGLQFWVQGAERFAWPFLWAKVPRNAGDDVRALAQTGLDQLSADHAAVVEDPVAFELLETTVKDAGTWKDLVSGLNGEIRKAVLGMTDLNEPSRIGAYAAVETRRGTTVDARIAMDEANFAGDLRDQYCEPLVRLNTHLFGGVMPPVPSIRFAIAAKRKEIAPQYLGVVTVDEVRATMDLPPLGGERGGAPASSGLTSSASAQTQPPAESPSSAA